MIQGGFGWRLLVTGALLAKLLCGSVSAQGATLDVRPTFLQLVEGQKVGVVYLINQDDTAHSYQIRPYRWLADGTEQRQEPTDEIIVNPAIVTIGAKQTQIVRYGLRGAPSPALESAYRVIIEEIPVEGEAKPASGLNVLLRISLPLFVRKTAQLPAPQLTASWRLADRDLHVLVRNGGPFTTRVVKVVIQGAGAPLELSQLHYVLPGGSTDFTFKLANGGAMPQHPSLKLSADNGDLTLPLGSGG